MSVIDKFETCLKAADAGWIQRPRKINTSNLVKGVISTRLTNVGLRQYCKQTGFASASAISRGRTRIPTAVLSDTLKDFVDMNVSEHLPRFFAVDSTKIQLLHLVVVSLEVAVMD